MHLTADDHLAILRDRYPDWTFGIGSHASASGPGHTFWWGEFAGRRVTAMSPAGVEAQIGTGRRAEAGL
jgi:hypothetical protein